MDDFADDRQDSGSEPGDGAPEPRRLPMTLEQAARLQAAYEAQRRAWAAMQGRAPK